MVSLSSASNIIIRTLNTDSELVSRLANKIADTAAQRGVPAHVKSVTLAAAMPLAALTEAFEVLGKAVLCTPVAVLKLGARLVGLNKNPSGNFGVLAQAWRVLKTLALLCLATVSTITLPIAILWPKIVVLAADLHRLRHKPALLPVVNKPATPEVPETAATIQTNIAPQLTKPWYSRVHSQAVDFYKRYPTAVIYSTAAAAALTIGWLLLPGGHLSIFDNANQADDKDPSHTAPEKQTAAEEAVGDEAINFKAGENHEGKLATDEILEDASMTINGEGSLFYEDGTLQYSGNFVDGTPKGYGQCFRPDGTLLFEGEVDGNKYQGPGTLYHGDSVIIGNFADSQFHGLMQRWNSGENTCYLASEGEFEYNAPVGDLRTYAEASA